MNRSSRRKLDCSVNGESSVRIKNRIHLEGRGPEDGSPLLRVRGNEELCVGHNSFILEEMNLLKK